MSTAVATLADIEKMEETPLAARDLPTSNYEAIQRTAARVGERPALHFFLQGHQYHKPVTYTYADMTAKINQTANMLRDLGIGETDVVSFLLPNLPQTYWTIYGGAVAGIFNPINPLLEPDVIADIMRAAETKVLVTLAPFPGTDLWEKAVQVAADVPSLETILQVDLAQFLGLLQKTVVNGMRLFQSAPEATVPIYNFDKRMKKYPADRLTFERDIQPDDISSYFHTGGTTGTPKIARHTHFGEVYDAWAAGSVTGLRGRELVMFNGLPLFHVNGVTVTGFLPWLLGGTIVLGTPQGYRGAGVFDNFWRIIEKYHITFFSGVPTVYTVLLDQPIDADISSLVYGLCGAAPMPIEVMTSFEERTGIRILEGYGLTEGTCVSSVNPPQGERRVGSIGYRLPYQEMVTAVLDDNGRFKRLCESNEVGTVIIRGPNNFAGYKETGHNVNAFIDSGDGRGPWVNTGDMGRQDEDGYFWLTGRKKELIIRGGHNIDPKLIEDPLHEHPAVALAAAVGRPDARVGELPVVYVQLKDGHTVTEAELLQFAKDHIGERAAVPKAIHITSEIPLTAVGKIFKPTLARREIAAVYQHELEGVQGATTIQTEAVGDKKLGTIVHIQIKTAVDADPAQVEADAREALGRYTVAYELTVE